MDTEAATRLQFTGAFKGERMTNKAFHCLSEFDLSLCYLLPES